MAVQAKAFENLEGPEFVRSSEVEAVGEKVLELHGGIGGVPRLHPIAEAVRDGELSILWLWDLFGVELRRAVVLHELLHIEVKRDKDNQPKFSVRKHDVEDFVDVARQYGPNALAGDGGRYVRAAAAFAGEPEPMVGKRSTTKATGGNAQAAARPAASITPDGLIVELLCQGANHVPGHTPGCPKYVVS